jgi:hypothetical protein
VTAAQLEQQQCGWCGEHTLCPECEGAADRPVETVPVVGGLL